MKKYLEKNRAKFRIIGEIISFAWVAGLLVLDFTGVIPQDTRWEILALAGFCVFTIQIYFHIKSKNRQLEDLLSPKLDLALGDYPSCRHQWTSGIYTTNTLYRVGLINLGGKTIDDVHVSLEKLEPQGIPFGPIKLTVMNQREDVMLNLNPGTIPSKFIDVIQVITSENQSIFSLQYDVKGVPNEIKPGNYRLNLLAEGKDVPSCRKSFLITWDGNNSKFVEKL
jgi:hypothetical protein